MFEPSQKVFEISVVIEIVVSK